MATYQKGIETKKRFVELTYNKLRHQDASTLTVRDLAKENNCSPAVLYRYFDNLEYLITVASVAFLDKYMRQYAKLMDSDKDPLQIYIEGWDLFNQYAFERPDVFYRLFWGKDNSVFGNAFQDYFELYPFDGSLKYTAYFYTMLFNSNMQERDFLMLRRIENLGVISGDEAQYYSVSNALLVKGLLEEAQSAPADVRDQLRQQASSLIRYNMRTTLEEHQLPLASS